MIYLIKNDILKNIKLVNIVLIKNFNIRDVFEIL